MIRTIPLRRLTAFGLMLSVCLASGPTTNPTSDGFAKEINTRVLRQHFLGDRGNLLALQSDEIYSGWRRESMWTFVRVEPDNFSAGAVTGYGPVTANECLLDAYLPPDGGAVWVECDPTATKYWAPLADGRQEGVLPNLITLPAGSVDPQHPLTARISGSFGEGGPFVTLSDAKRTLTFSWGGHRGPWREVHPTTKPSGK